MCRLTIRRWSAPVCWTSIFIRASTAAPASSSRYHITGYFSLGSSNDSSDPKNSLNKLFGATMSEYLEDGPGSRRALFEVRQRFRVRNLHDVHCVARPAGRICVSISRQAVMPTAPRPPQTALRISSISLFDTNLGSRLFVESMFTVQRGGIAQLQPMDNHARAIRFNNRAADQEVGECKPSLMPTAVAECSSVAPCRSGQMAEAQPRRPPSVLRKSRSQRIWHNSQIFTARRPSRRRSWERMGMWSIRARPVRLSDHDERQRRRLSTERVAHRAASNHDTNSRNCPCW